MRNIFTSLLFLITVQLASAQIYNLTAANNGQTFTTCRGIFQSSGGDPYVCNGYGNGQDRTITFCSGTPGLPIRVSFAYWDLETGYDYLYVYDGPSTASPLVGTINGTGYNYATPMYFTSSGTCLTFRFRSDNTVPWCGWQALIGCSPQLCGTNLPAADNCTNATQICDLNNYCGSTSGWYTPDAAGIGSTGSGLFCGSIENNSWVSFVASATQASFQVTSSNCILSGSGIQAMILNSTNCTTFNARSNCVNQSTAAGTFTLTSYNNLVPGTRYYLMIDGFGGNICDYSIRALTGVQAITITSPSGAGGTGTICQGAQTTLTANNAPAGTTYTWSPAGSIVGPNNTATVTVNPTVNTTYSCTMVIPNACANQTENFIVNVRPKPPVTVNSPSICAGNTTTLTAGGASTYTWTGGLPNGATVTTPVLNANTSYTVTGTDANGCTNTAVANITVNAKPTVTVNSPTICAGQSVTLTASGANTYTWTGGLPNGATVNTPVLNSTTSYTVTGTGTGGCTNTAVATVTVTSAPVVSVNSPTICDGQSVTLTASGATNYTWSTGATGPSITVSPSSNTSYTVTGSLVGCATTSTATSTVTVRPKPTVSVNSPVICESQPATLNASGASTYTWTGGLPNGASVTTPVLSTTTSYTVTGTDANGCSNTAISTVTVNPKPVVSVSSPTICESQTATLNANGAATYTWTGGLPNGASVTTPVLSSTTSYTVTGTTNGCSNTATSTVTVNPKPTVNVNSPSICDGQSATLNAGGASTYTWTGGLPNGANVTTPVLSSTTSYTVTGTDANGCVNTATATVTVNPNPTVSVNSPTICEGQTATLNASGASTYTWTGGLPNGASVTTPVLSTTTSYTVTGTDANGCSNTAIATVTVNPKPVVNVNSPTICESQTATLNANGAATYTWTGGLPNGASVTTPVLSSTTSYTVTGTDANGCSNTATSTVTVNPKPTVSVNSPSICDGQTATLNASGASTYTWTGGLPNVANVTTPVLSSTTSYTVTGMDANGCSNTAIATVTVNPKPVVSVNSPTICESQTATLNASGASTYTWTGGLPNGASVTTPVLSSTTSYTVTGTDVNGCNNTAIATVTVNPKPVVNVNSPTICESQTATLNANGAATYTWTGGLPNGASVTTPPLSSTTSYTVTGTAVNGCSNTATSTVTVNPKPTVSVNSPSICSGQTATLNASGASTYTWTGGLPNGASVTTPVLLSTTSYTVTGTGANGCVNTATSTVTVNANPTISVNSPSICDGQTATLNAIGASTYTWTGGLPNGASVTTPPLSSTTSYTVTGTAANGCSNTATSTVTVNANPTISVNSPTICSGQTATLNASGASTYTWTGGLPNGASVTTPVLSSSTSYTVTGTTASGCSNTAIATVTVTAAPNVTVNSEAICAGQSVVLTASGADTYTWNTGASGASINVSPAATTAYTVTGFLTGCPISSTAIANVTVNALPNVAVNSPTICDGQTATLNASGASAYIWTGGLPNGASVTTLVLSSTTSYTVTGTDANGCVNTATSTVTVNSNPTISVNSPVICESQTATLNASGASSYTWTGGLPNGASVTTPVLSSTTSYTVTGTNANGCSNTATAIVTVNASPTVSVNSPTICAGNSTTLNASGASTYSWTGGLPNGSSVTTPVLSTTTAYTVTGTNANGCSNTATATVTVNPNPTVSVNSPTICAGNSTTLNASGASGYTWTGGLPNGSSVTTPVLSSTTSYTVTGTDANGCSNTATATVTVNPIPTVSVNSPTICSGQTAMLNASGASTYTWTGGLPNSASVTTPVLSSTTTYTVTGTTASGCSNTATATVTVTPAPVVSVNAETICAGQTAVLTASGADTYTWSNGSSGASISVSPGSSTSYTVTGLLIGCATPGSATATVTVNALPVVAVNSPAICTGNTAILNASGANTYTWTGGLPNGGSVTTPVLSTTTSYTVTGTDANGCSNTATSTVIVNPNPTINVNSPTICAVQTAVLNASGASTYTWSGGLPNGSTVTTPVLNSTASYTVSGTDANGCVNTATATVTVNALPNVNASASAICEGFSAVLTANGASTYTWNGGLPNGSTVNTPVLNSTTSYTVTGTDINGCSNSANVTVIVYPKPTISVNAPVICAGNSAVLTASGANTYTWSGGLPDGASVTTPVLNSTTNYTVTGTDVNGCRNTATTAVQVNAVKTTNISQTICEGQSVVIGGQTFPNTGTYTVRLQTSQGCDSTVVLNLTVNPQLIVDVQVASSANDICGGELVTFTASPVNGGVAPRYQWYVNTTPVGTNSPVYSNSGLQDGDSVWVQLQSSETCVRINPAFSEPVVMKVSRIDYTLPLTAFCAGSSAVVDLNIPQNNYTVIWKYGPAIQTTTNSDAISLEDTASGNLKFTIAFGNNCLVRDSIAYTVNPLPVIEALADRYLVKYGDSVQLDVSALDTYHYQWTTQAQLDNDTLAGPLAIITSPALFTLLATDANGCRSQDTLFVDMTDECLEDYVFVPTGFSPNYDGVNDCFGIVYAPPMTEFKLVIFNRWGEKLFEASDIDNCWDGMYKGTDALVDGYTYVIGFRCYNGKFIQKTGIVTLIR